MSKIKRVCYSISTRTDERLEKLAKEANMKKSNIVDAGINLYLDRIEKMIKE